MSFLAPEWNASCSKTACASLALIRFAIKWIFPSGPVHACADLGASCALSAISRKPLSSKEPMNFPTEPCRNSFSKPAFDSLLPLASPIDALSASLPPVAPPSAAVFSFGFKRLMTSACRARVFSNSPANSNGAFCFSSPSICFSLNWISFFNPSGSFFIDATRLDILTAKPVGSAFVISGMSISYVLAPSSRNTIAFWL